MAKQKQRKGLSDLIGETLTAGQEASEVVKLEAVKTSNSKPEKINTSLYLPRAVHRQVKQLALTEDVKPHDLYLEALDMLFKQRGLESIDSLTTS